MSIKLRIINVSYSYKAFDFQESFSQLSNGTLLGVALVENSYGLISTKCMVGVTPLTNSKVQQCQTLSSEKHVMCGEYPCVLKSEPNPGFIAVM